jgi:hypothetical protein
VGTVCQVTFPIVYSWLQAGWCKKKLSASFFTRKRKLLFLHPHSDWLRLQQQINDVKVVWQIYGNRARKVKSQSWIFLQSDPTLVKSDEALFLFLMNVTYLVHKLLFCFMR